MVIWGGDEMSKFFMGIFSGGVIKGNIVNYVIVGTCLCGASTTYLTLPSCFYGFEIWNLISFDACNKYWL